MSASTNNTAAVITTSYFHFDFFERQIVGTKACFDKASKGSGSEYDELAAKMAAHPDYTLVAKKQSKKINRAKHTYHGLDYKFMERYIRIQMNQELLMKQYQNAKKVAKDAGRSVYPFVKHWFLDQFGNEDGYFDMEEAEETITAALTIKANSIEVIETAETLNTVKATAVAEAESIVSDAAIGC